jgi:23S rRNA (cytidine1920-2'-O)/16S rRNA (cytidine1409-2'-O)-methyltransferase
MSEKTPRKRLRVDVLLVELGLVESRAKAQALVLAGLVMVADQRVDKPGTLVAAGSELRLKRTDQYVSRGGKKLEGALDALTLDPRDKICVDVGASTGGFTDCLLQRGAHKVYAVDVGHGLLAEKLRQDPRVVVMDRTNARHLKGVDFPDVVDWVVVDASFIGISQLIGALAEVLPSGGLLLAMIKPQFEVGREQARRAKGVIRDPELRASAIETARATVAEAGFRLVSGNDSTLAGPKGNVEYFLHAIRETSV